MTPPRPPIRLAPPMTTAAMTLSSAPTPTCAEPTPVRLVEMMPGDRRERPGDDVDGENVARHGDAGEAHRLLVRADRRDDAAEPREVQHDAADQEDGEHQDHRLRQAEKEPGAEIGERRRRRRRSGSAGRRK